MVGDVAIRKFMSDATFKKEVKLRERREKEARERRRAVCVLIEALELEFNVPNPSDLEMAGHGVWDAEIDGLCFRVWSEPHTDVVAWIPDDGESAIRIENAVQLGRLLVERKDRNEAVRTQDKG